MFWIKVIAIVVLAIVLSRRRRGELIAPVVLIIVGVHDAASRRLGINPRTGRGRIATAMDQYGVYGAVKG
ncbi:hypothetical protein ACSS7Z_12885 [Microbacterium sp. A82]|uniref:hypothetical protein n=1 Tax=Microbacterium sp. A82 TaxID=3450452 RepID=UPI003F3412EF